MSEEPTGREYPQWMLGHADWGDPDCCGIIVPLERDNVTDLKCTECGAVLKTIPTGEASAELDRMEAAGDVASAQCPHCGAVHLAPGLTTLLAFVCRECGEGVTNPPGHNL